MLWRAVCILGLLAAGGAAVYFLAPGKSAPTPTPAATAPPPEQTPAAETASSGDIVLECKGYVIPVHQILVSPKVNGMIVHLSIQEGMRVKKGDILAQLEDTDYRADYEHCAATLESAKQRLLELQRGFRPEEISQAKAELDESESQLVQLKAELDRTKELIKRKAISQQDLEVTDSHYWAMYRRVERLRFALKLMRDGPRVERIDNARAEVRQAAADVAKTKWRLDNCTIRAPISGTILKKNAEEGNIVNTIAFNGSYSLCEMADLSDLEVDLSIQERDVARVFKNQKCKVRAEAYPERQYEGHVSRLMPIADRAKGAVPVRVKLVVPAEEEGVYLKPEMGVNVSFLVAEKAKAKAAPAAAEKAPTAAIGAARSGPLSLRERVRVRARWFVAPIPYFELPSRTIAMKTRIMYIEYKGGGISGPARIGRVTFSKSGRSLYYRGRQFQTLAGQGFKANYFDVATGEEYWISGCKKDGTDRLYSGATEIDEDVAEEYWSQIRGKPQPGRERQISRSGKHSH